MNEKYIQALILGSLKTISARRGLDINKRIIDIIFFIFFPYKLCNAAENLIIRLVFLLSLGWEKFILIAYLFAEIDGS